jgi:hypothetical protein
MKEINFMVGEDIKNDRRGWEGEGSVCMCVGGTRKKEGIHGRGVGRSPVPI